MKAPMRALYVVVAAVLTACQLGPQIATMAAPRQPGGVTVIVTVNKSGRQGRSQYEGELVAVRDGGTIIALQPDATSTLRLTFVPWNIVDRMTATQLPGFHAKPERRGSPPRAQLDKMRLVSRYPQGVSSELMAKLLASYGQASLDSLRPRSP